MLPSYINLVIGSGDLESSNIQFHSCNCILANSTHSFPNQIKNYTSLQPIIQITWNKIYLLSNVYYNHYIDGVSDWHLYFLFKKVKIIIKFNIFVQFFQNTKFTYLRKTFLSTSSSRLLYKNTCYLHTSTWWLVQKTWRAPTYNFIPAIVPWLTPLTHFLST